MENRESDHAWPGKPRGTCLMFSLPTARPFVGNENFSLITGVSAAAG